MSIKRAVIIESGTLLVLGAIGLLGGLNSYLQSDARSQSSSLRPGMYVVVLSVALILTALAYAYFRLRKASAKPSESVHEPREAGASRIVAMVFGAVALYASLIPFVGYLPSTLLFLLTEFRLLGVESWRRNAVLTIVASAIFYLVFIRYGEMAFPRGSLLE